METQLKGFFCPKCKSTRNRSTLMRELPEKKLWLATCMQCGSQGMIEEKIEKIKKPKIIL